MTQRISSGGGQTWLEHGDLFVWATNFDIKPRRLTSVRSIEKVPVPTDFLFPADTRLISLASKIPKIASENEVWTRAKDSELLKPTKGCLTNLYYIALMKSAGHDGEARPHFVGRKQVWDDLKVVKFMLGRKANELIADKSICLVLNESKNSPNLKRSIDMAWENGAIPVFFERLSPSDEISCVCDSKLHLPVGLQTPTGDSKELWQRLLVSWQEAPKTSLERFIRQMSALPHTKSSRRGLARAYMPSFQVNGRQVVHPAVVVPRADHLPA